MQAESAAERPTTAILRVGANVARQGISILLGLGLTILWARALGTAGNGMYALALLLPALLTTFLNLGLPSAQVFFVGQGIVTPRMAWLVVLRMTSILTITGIVIGGAITLVGSSAWFSGVPASALWLSLACFPMGLLQTIAAGLLQAVEDFARLNRVTLVPPAVALAVSAASIALGRASLTTAVVAFLIGQIIGTAAALRAVVLHLGHASNEHEDKPSAYRRQFVLFGLKSYLSNVLTFVNYRADLFIVNAFLNPTATGLYVVATQLGERTWVVSYAVSTVIFPRLTRRHLSMEHRRRLTTSATTWTLLASAIIAGALALLAGPLIRMLFGESYVGATDALTWLLPGLVLTGMARVLANGIAAHGRPGLNLGTAAVVATLNVVLNLVLVPKLGIVGAAIATTGAYATHAALTVFLFSRLTGTPWWRCFTAGGRNPRSP